MTDENQIIPQKEGGTTKRYHHKKKKRKEPKGIHKGLLPHPKKGISSCGKLKNLTFFHSHRRSHFYSVIKKEKNWKYQKFLSRRSFTRYEEAQREHKKNKRKS